MVEKKKEVSSIPEDMGKTFELAIKEREKDVYVLRLYVSGLTPNSQRAVDNVRRICDEHLKGRYQLEIIDIYQQPNKLKDDQVVAAPTLVKELPLPLRKFIGDLSKTERILVGLDLKKKE